MPGQWECAFVIWHILYLWANLIIVQWETIIKGKVAFFICRSTKFKVDNEKFMRHYGGSMKPFDKFYKNLF